MPSGKRHLIAVAGPPASGKSTLAEALAQAPGLAARGAVVVPMDGFHLDNAVLDAHGLRARKGSPPTFDLRGFASLLAQIAEGGRVFYPVFDRARDLSVAAAAELPDSCELVIVEGNYLLFDQDGWRDLSLFWNLSVFLDVPEDILHARLCKRWLDHGHSQADAIARAEANDLPNARMVNQHRTGSDLVFKA